MQERNHQIGPFDNLNPDRSTAQVEGEIEEVMNVDAVVLMLKETDTPQAEAFRESYVAEFDRQKNENPDLSPDEWRKKAVLTVLPTKNIN